MKNYHFFKRIFEVIISAIGVIALLPLFVIVAFWIKCTSEGPIVYTHERIGKNGKPFKVCKFRTMIVGARDLQRKGVPDDKLITSAGKFLRKTFLDEILQLLNVFKGEVSLIGPRPLDKEIFDTWIKKNKDWMKIVEIKPGMTSVDSVADYLPQKEHLRFEQHFKNLSKMHVPGNKYKFMKHRYILDKYYVDNESFWLDLRILFYTFLLVLRRTFSKK